MPSGSQEPIVYAPTDGAAAVATVPQEPDVSSIDEPEGEQEIPPSQWFRVCRETTPGAGTVPVNWENPEFKWYWDEFMKPEKRERARRWYPREPPSKTLIQAEMVSSAFTIPERHFLLRKPRTRQLVANMAGQPVTIEDVEHYLRPNRTNKLNADRSYTEEQYGSTPGLFTSHLIRRGRAGLGKRFLAYQRREMTRPGDFHPTAQDSHVLSMFSWNAGNLERRVEMISSTPFGHSHPTSRAFKKPPKDPYSKASTMSVALPPFQLLTEA